MRAFRSFNRRGTGVPKTLVTYYVDTGVSYTEKIKKGDSVLSPTSFTPTKTGYTFLGWREDTVANGTVLTNKTAEGKTMSLYAVFYRTLYLSYNGNGNTGGSTATQGGNQYYNNTNYLNPTFTIRSNGFSKTYYSFKQWRLNSTSGTAYAAGASITITSDTTMYADWAITTLISGGTIIDTGKIALTSCTPAASESITNPPWWHGSTSTTATSATASGILTGSDWEDDPNQKLTTSVTIKLNSKYNGKSVTITYSLHVWGRYNGVYARCYNGSSAVFNYTGANWNGDYNVTRTDTFTVQNGTITIGAQYDDTSWRWNPGCYCSVSALTVPVV